MAENGGGSSSAWWPICLSEEVTNKKPVALHCGDQPLAAYRDAGGVVRVLEDRCPHRRAPLSLGRMTPEGDLQCGYHGWIFDGASGNCKAIPNLSADERVPPRYKAEAFKIAERDGFVYLWTGAADTAPALAPAGLRGEGKHAHGVEFISLPHEEYVAAFLDKPSLVMDIPQVRITDFDISDLHPDGDDLLLHRAGVWKTAIEGDRFEGNYPLRIDTRTHRVTGATHLTLRDDANVVMLEALLAFTAASRGVTGVRWRSVFRSGGKSVLGAALSVRVGFGAPALHIKHFVDGAALKATIAGPSLQWRNFQTQAAAEAA